MYWLPRYLSCTFLYGAIHSTINIPRESLYTNYTNGKHEKQTVLFTHKLGYVLFGGGLGISLWPLMLRNDLIQLECFLRGKDAANYGIKHVFDDW